MKDRKYYLMLTAVVLFSIVFYGYTVLKRSASENIAQASPESEIPVQEAAPPPWTDPPWLAGDIYDQSINPAKKIVGVNVVATHKYYGISLSYTSGPGGSYRIFLPLAGGYNVVAKHPSYSNYSFTTVNIDTPNIEYRKDLNMTHGQNCLGDPVRVIKSSTVVYKPDVSAALSVAANGDAIQIQNIVSSGDKDFIAPDLLSISGGYDSCFNTVTAMTTFQGNVRVTHPTSTMSNIEIQ